MRQMNTWDDAKRDQNIRDHGIDFAELEVFLTAIFSPVKTRFRRERRKLMSTKRGSHVTKSVKGKTDWIKLKAMKDSSIAFTDDAPQTSPEDWADAIAHRGLPLPGRKEQIALRVDADVLSWFREQGTGWQTRMNAVLKAYRDALEQQRGALEGRRAAGSLRRARR